MSDEQPTQQEVEAPVPEVLEERYGPAGRLLRRWSLGEEGRAVCVLDALDTASASAEEIAAAEAGNAAVRDALGYVAPPAPALTVADYQAAIDAHVESVAAAKGYKTAASCAGYVSSTIPAWSAEATAFIAWRDQVWLEVYEALAAVQGGAPAPGLAALVEGLPAMVWPA